MRTAMTPASMSLALLCGGLALVLSYEMAMPPPNYRLPDVPSRTLAPIVILQPGFVAQPIETFSAIDERPLFNSLRKPVQSPEQTTAVSGPPPAPSASLVGVIIDGKQRLALLRSPNSAFALSFGIGSTLDGWQISEIDPDRIKLRSGTFDHEIDLNANHLPPPQSGMLNSPMQPPPFPGQAVAPVLPVSAAP
jgi:hypothetical protein